VITALSKALMPAAADDSYVAVPTEFITGRKCDDLYAPSNPLSSFPPIVVEMQKKVDHKFLTRVIQYCTLTFERYNSA
ncbi:hypothetical protein BDF20DRAFT_800633, partial [Mycotypha africana]|uniref:uncharacterized protein n=1 Tax=Mycotypha africana TaxID=64632 RepID=UPI002300B58C